MHAAGHCWGCAHLDVEQRGVADVRDSHGGRLWLLQQLVALRVAILGRCLLLCVALPHLRPRCQPVRELHPAPRLSGSLESAHPSTHLPGL